MPPRVPFRIVRRGGKFAVLVTFLPIRCPLSIGPMARGAILLIDRTTGGDARGIDWRQLVCPAGHRDTTHPENHRAHQQRTHSPVPGIAVILWTCFSSLLRSALLRRAFRSPVASSTRRG